MKRFLYHDLIIAGNWCNLKCSYCTSVQDADWFGSNTSASRRGRGATIALDDVLDMVDALRRHVDAPVLKVSGGELFLLANAADLVEQLAARYAHVQVLSNGTELTPALVGRIARLGNVSFNLSLDGHTPQMNAMRWRSPKIGERTTAAFDAMVRECDLIEITAVISDANAPTFADFLDFLQRQVCAIVVIPIPVRGVHAARLFSPAARTQFADFLLGMNDTYDNVLGPRAYYRKLAQFLKFDDGQRRERCHLVRAAVQLFDTGAVTPCPVGWTAEIANVKKDGIDAVAGAIGTHKLYDLLTRQRPRVPVCRNCFSQADVLNLYIEGAVTLEEMARLPMYRVPAAQARLRELRRTATACCGAERESPSDDGGRNHALLGLQ